MSVTLRSSQGSLGLTTRYMDVIELNRTFASRAIACMRELGVRWDNANPQGSGISLSYPRGCTGARQVVTIMHDMRKRSLSYSFLTMCIGGGQGMAVLVERKVGLASLLLIFRTPGGIGTLGPVAGASPVPFAAIAEKDVQAQSLPHSEVQPLRPAWSLRSHADIIEMPDKECNAPGLGVLLCFLRQGGEEFSVVLRPAQPLQHPGCNLAWVGGIVAQHADYSS